MTITTMMIILMWLVVDIGWNVLSGREQSEIQYPQCVGVALPAPLSTTADYHVDQRLQHCLTIDSQCYCSRPCCHLLL